MKFLYSRVDIVMPKITDNLMFLLIDLYVNLRKNMKQLEELPERNEFG